MDLTDHPEKKREKKESQIESEVGSGDYYFNEEGLLVFTREYHLKRGYCCKNGCKHCPYGFKKA
jgi:hypothetical protein